MDNSKKLKKVYKIVANFLNIEYDEVVNMKMKNLNRVMDLIIFFRKYKQIKFQYFIMGMLLFTCIFYIINFFFVLYFGL